MTNEGGLLVLFLGVGVVVGGVLGGVVLLIRFARGQQVFRRQKVTSPAGFYAGVVVSLTFAALSLAANWMWFAAFFLAFTLLQVGCIRAFRRGWRG
jgi:hypothetical protein